MNTYFNEMLEKATNGDAKIRKNPAFRSWLNGLTCDYMIFDGMFLKPSNIHEFMETLKAANIESFMLTNCGTSLIIIMIDICNEGAKIVKPLIVKATNKYDEIESLECIHIEIL